MRVFISHGYSNHIEKIISLENYRISDPKFLAFLEQSNFKIQKHAETLLDSYGHTIDLKG